MVRRLQGPLHHAEWGTSKKRAGAQVTRRRLCTTDDAGEGAGGGARRRSQEHAALSRAVESASAVIEFRHPLPSSDFERRSSPAALAGRRNKTTESCKARDIPVGVRSPPLV